MESCPTELGVLTLPQCSSPEQPLVLRGVRRVRCCSFIAQRAGPGPEAGLTPRPGHRPLLCASSQLTQPSPSLAGGLGLFTAYQWPGATGPTLLGGGCPPLPTWPASLRCFCAPGLLLGGLSSSCWGGRQEPWEHPGRCLPPPWTKGLRSTVSAHEPPIDQGHSWP